MATAPAYNPNLKSKEALVGAGFGGYKTWNDETSILNDYKNTGGADKYTGGGTDFSVTPDSADQLPSFLADFQKSAMESLSTLKPTEAPTFEELKNNLTPSTPAPTPISRVDSRNQLRTQFGVTELETELNTIKTQETQITDELRALTGTEEGKPVALNVISGRITEEERVAQQRLDSVIRQKNSIVNELNTKYSVIETYVKDLGLDYNDAVEAYNAEFDKNYKVQSMVSELSGKAFDQKLSILKTGVDITMDAAKFQQSVKQQNIDNARANLTTMTNAIAGGNLSYDQMSPDQKLNIQKLEIQSGIPVGTMSQFKKEVDPKANVMFTTSNEGVTQIGFFNPATGQIEVKSYGTSTKSKTSEGNLKEAANNTNYPDLVENFAGVASLEEINKAYQAGDMYKKYGKPTEDPKAIKLAYQVARGDITLDDARTELGL